MFYIVLVEPEIPPNTGNIGRLCLATGSTLHLVRPLGFSLDEKSLRRAGLDYWAEVDVTLWDSFEELAGKADAGAAFHFATTKTARPLWSVPYSRGDYLVFGSETRGLPASLLGKNPDRCIGIPMRGTRSLNLATAVAIVLYEGVRQLGSEP